MIQLKAQFRDLRDEDIVAAKNVAVTESNTSDWILCRNKEGALALSYVPLAKINPVAIDFCSGKSIFKRNSVLSKKQILTKAVAFKKNGDTLLDLTAGFGEDAILFAAMGFSVTAIERQPLIYLLLQDAIKRFETFDDTNEIIQQKRIRFVLAEADDFVLSLSPYQFDCLYYDPMFPGSAKTALSSGKMQILQKLTTGDDVASEKFLSNLLSLCKDRLVIKRGLNSPQLLANRSHSFKGKAVRYDMYSQHSIH
jgi:16S rRNA (guanine1516-N2)-methyltransferase